MEKINLSVISKTKAGNIHLSVQCDNDDSGVLYLTKSQYDDFLKVIRLGSFQSSIDFNVTDTFTSNDDEPYDNSMFFSND